MLKIMALAKLSSASGLGFVPVPTEIIRAFFKASSLRNFLFNCINVLSVYACAASLSVFSSSYESSNIDYLGFRFVDFNLFLFSRLSKSH